ncbi:hypothetical protein [Candidatus Alkanophaga liquidiphilum]
MKVKALLLVAIIFAAVFAMFGSAAADHTMQRCLITPVDNIEAQYTAYHITMMSAACNALDKGNWVVIDFSNMPGTQVDPALTTIIIAESDKFYLYDVDPSTDTITLAAKDHVSCQEQVTVLVAGIKNPDAAGTYPVTISWDNNTETGIAYVEITKPSYVGSTLGNIVGDVVYIADTFVTALAGTDIGADLADVLAEVVDIVEDLVNALP